MDLSMAEGQGRTLVALGLGQFLSLLLTAVAFSASELARRGIDAPVFQSLSNYILLAIVYGFLFLRRKYRCQVPWYVYFLLAFIDVEANYLAVQAYQYTSITSVMLLDCWTIPCAIMMTWLLLKTEYLLGHFVGVSISIVGLVLVILSDVHDSDRSGGSNVIFGDALVVAASMLYAFTNVSQEFLVKTNDRVELLANIGLFGSLISACQLLILERHEIQSIRWTASAVLPFISYGVSMFSFYTLVPVLLQISGSAMLNLSLLTSDMWAVAIRAVVYHERVDWLYFLAFATVTIGLSVYSLFGDPASSVGSLQLINSYKRIETHSAGAGSDDTLPKVEQFRLQSSDDELEA